MDIVISNRNNKKQIWSNSASIIFFLITTLFIFPNNALKLNSHSYFSQNQYDEDAYANDLTNLQSRFTKDVNSIKQKFTNINLGLANTNISQASQITFLQ